MIAVYDGEERETKAQPVGDVAALVDALRAATEALTNEPVAVG